MQLSLRPALETDFALCESLTRSNMAAYHSARGDTWDPQRFVTNWAVFENFMILADGQVAGLLRLSVVDRALEIRDLQLLPAFRGQGIGSWAVAQAMSQAASRGIGLLRLRVFVENPAMRLYARLGFKIDATDANGKVHMSYALSASPSGEYAGSCHCGAIGFRYFTAQPPAQWSIRACQCMFCRAHAALSTSDPAGRIEFHGAGSGALQRYRFGQHTADFLLCRECGVYLGAVMESPSGMHGIVNVNALRPIPELPAVAAPMDYGTESADERTGRREQRWSPASIAGTP